MTANTVSAFFDSYAEEFDAIYGTRNTAVNRVVNKLLRRSMRMRFEKTISACQPIEGRSVIDIGTGPGHYAVMLARQGASRVLGLDFAEGMVDVATKNAQRAGVGDNCSFDFGDFLTIDVNETFDYSIVMGFMDYIEDQRHVIDKVLSLTERRALFSFPLDGGFLAWQRKMRYRSRCKLIMYTRQQVHDIFDSCEGWNVTIEPISRDFFVTAEKK